MNGKRASGEDGNEGHVIEHWGKSNTYYKVAENSSKFSSIVRWEVELVSDDLEDKIWSFLSRFYLDEILDLELTME